MKKNITLFALASIFGGIVFATLTGCSKDASKQIVGKWERTAIRYSYSGSPISDENYGNYMTMDECSGCATHNYIFKNDNTGMLISEWLDFGSASGVGRDTIRFTYTVDGNNGVITPLSDVQEVYGGTTTFTIQNISARELTIYTKSSWECLSPNHSWGDTTYTRVSETYDYYKKKIL